MLFAILAPLYVWFLLHMLEEIYNEFHSAPKFVWAKQFALLPKRMGVGYVQHHQGPLLWLQFYWERRGPGGAHWVKELPEESPKVSRTQLRLVK